MGYRTILAVVDTAENTRHLDAFVAQLAQQFSSHVIGLHMETLAAVPLVAPMEIPDPATVQAVQDVAHKETEESQKVFAEGMTANGVSNEWRSFASSVASTCSLAAPSVRTLANRASSSPS